ncbi:MAG: response regulator [Chloroflexi bacterium]|nr:response regulator [Chloroflexota bacterium]
MPDIADWTVLLVDDEPDSLFLVHDILTLNGAKVVQAASGEEGLMHLNAIYPTLVVLDLAMPRPDGWDLLVEIRSRPQFVEVPVVAITAFYSGQVAQKAYEAGFDAFFPKPIKTQVFLEKLRELVN